MFLKIQTWFPYNVQIYLNGREYLSRLLKAEGISYSMYNNSFSYLEDFEKAQELADCVLNKKLSHSFDGMVKKINCLLPEIEEVFHHSYYWCIDQCENRKIEPAFHNSRPHLYPLQKSNLSCHNCPGNPLLNHI